MALLQNEKCFGATLALWISPQNKFAADCSQNTKLAYFWIKIFFRNDPEVLLGAGFPNRNVQSLDVKDLIFKVSETNHLVAASGPFFTGSIPSRPRS